MLFSIFSTLFFADVEYYPQIVQRLGVLFYAENITISVIYDTLLYNFAFNVAYLQQKGNKTHFTKRGSPKATPKTKPMKPRNLISSL
jgi:hypothetical protein